MDKQVVSIPTPSGITNLLLVGEPVSEVKAKMVDGTTGHFYLVDSNGSSASQIRVMTPNGIFALGMGAETSKTEEGDFMKLKGLQPGKEIMIWGSTGTLGDIILLDDAGTEVQRSVGTPPSLRFTPEKSVAKIKTNLELSSHAELSDHILNISEVLTLKNNVLLPLDNLTLDVDYTASVLPGLVGGQISLISSTGAVLKSTTTAAPAITFAAAAGLKLKFVTTEAKPDGTIEAIVLLDKIYRKGNGSADAAKMVLKEEESATLTGTMDANGHASAHSYMPFLEPGRYYTLEIETVEQPRTTIAGLDTPMDLHRRDLLVSPGKWVTHFRAPVSSKASASVVPAAYPGVVQNYKITLRKFEPAPGETFGTAIPMKLNQPIFGKVQAPELYHYHKITGLTIGKKYQVQSDAVGSETAEVYSGNYEYINRGVNGEWVDFNAPTETVYVLTAILPYDNPTNDMNFSVEFRDKLKTYEPSDELKAGILLELGRAYSDTLTDTKKSQIFKMEGLDPEKKYVVETLGSEDTEMTGYGQDGRFADNGYDYGEGSNAKIEFIGHSSYYVEVFEYDDNGGTHDYDIVYKEFVEAVVLPGDTMGNPSINQFVSGQTYNASMTPQAGTEWMEVRGFTVGQTYKVTSTGTESIGITVRKTDISQVNTTTGTTPDGVGAVVVFVATDANHLLQIVPAFKPLSNWNNPVPIKIEKV